MPTKSKTSAVPTIELWDLDRIKPYPANTKLHPEEQINRLARAIKRFGWDQPIVVDKDGVIIKGHGRRLAALKLGLEQVPVWVRKDLTQEEADAARIADNATIGNQFDTRAMQAEITRLLKTMPEFDIEDFGLTEKDRSILLSDITEPDIDALMTDTHEEIAKSKHEESEMIAKADKDEVSVTEILGFKKITIEQARVLNLFVASAQALTGKQGRDAFFDHLDAVAAA